MNDPRPAPVTVRIAGEEHVIRSSADPEHTRRCVRVLDERIARIRERGGPAETGRAAVLAALSLTDELLRLEEAHSRLQAEMTIRADALTRRVDVVLGGQAPESVPESDAG
jgi:cell division protein ZapA (FtsZ GTPase activity inhibitor)